MFFVSGSAPFAVFFTALLFLGSLFGKIFRSELLFLSVVVGLVFFDSVLPRFLFYFLVFSLPKMSRKNSLDVRSAVWKNFGSEFLFFGVGVGRVFWCCFAHVFALLFGFSLPKMSRKNSLDVRSCASGFFGLAVRSFFGEVFRALKCPIFAAQKWHVKSSPFLCFFSGFFRSFSSSLSLPEGPTIKKI